MLLRLSKAPLTDPLLPYTTLCLSSRRALLSRDQAGTWGPGASRRDHPRNLWRGGARLRVLWPGTSRGRAGGLGLPVRDERPVVAPDASRPCLWPRVPSTGISSGARPRGENRLFAALRESDGVGKGVGVMVWFVV